MNITGLAKMKAWESQRSEIQRVSEEFKDGKRSEAIYTNNNMAKRIVARLAVLQVPVKVINLGAGAKRIVRAEHVCQACKGKGYLKTGKKS